MAQRHSDFKPSVNDRTYHEVEYLKKNLGPILVAALAEICIRRPADPIEYLGHWLLRWRYNEELKRRDVQNALEVVRQKQWAQSQQEAGALEQSEFGGEPKHEKSNLVKQLIMGHLETAMADDDEILADESKIRHLEHDQHVEVVEEQQVGQPQYDQVGGESQVIHKVYSQFENQQTGSFQHQPHQTEHEQHGQPAPSGHRLSTGSRKASGGQPAPSGHRLSTGSRGQPGQPVPSGHRLSTGSRKASGGQPDQPAPSGHRLSTGSRKPSGGQSEQPAPSGHRLSTGSRTASRQLQHGSPGEGENGAEGVKRSSAAESRKGSNGEELPSPLAQIGGNKAALGQVAGSELTVNEQRRASGGPEQEQPTQAENGRIGEEVPEAVEAEQPPDE